MMAFNSGGNGNDKTDDCGSSNGNNDNGGGNVKNHSGSMWKVLLLEFVIDTFFMKFEIPRTFQFNILQNLEVILLLA